MIQKTAVPDFNIGKMMHEGDRMIPFRNDEHPVTKNELRYEEAVQDEIDDLSSKKSYCQYARKIG